MGMITSKKRLTTARLQLWGSRIWTDFSVPYIRLENSRQALTYLSAAFYDWPARKLTVIGVTGTDGKTTTSNLIYKILARGGTQGWDDLNGQRGDRR